MNNIKLNLKTTGYNYEWYVKDLFLNGKSIEELEQITPQNLIIHNHLMQFTHNDSGPAIVLYKDGIKLYESFWVDGLPSYSKPSVDSYQDITKELRDLKLIT